MVKFELSEKMVEIIAAALGAQPYQSVAPVIDELRRQISAQQTRPESLPDKPNGKIIKKNATEAVKQAE